MPVALISWQKFCQQCGGGSDVLCMFPKVTQLQRDYGWQGIDVLSPGTHSSTTSMVQGVAVCGKGVPKFPSAAAAAAAAPIITQLRRLQ